MFPPVFVFFFFFLRQKRWGRRKLVWRHRLPRHLPLWLPPWYETHRDEDELQECVCGGGERVLLKTLSLSMSHIHTHTQHTYTYTYTHTHTHTHTHTVCTYDNKFITIPVQLPCGQLIVSAHSCSQQRIQSSTCSICIILQYITR